MDSQVAIIPLHVHYISGVDIISEMERMHQRVQTLEDQVQTMRRHLGLLMEHLAAQEPAYIPLFGLDRPRQP